MFVKAVPPRGPSHTRLSWKENSANQLDKDYYCKQKLSTKTKRPRTQYVKHFQWTRPITKDDYASTTPQAQWSIPYHIPRHSFLSLSTKKRRIRENFKNTRIKSGSRLRSQAKDAKPPVTYNWLPRANTLREQTTQLQKSFHTKCRQTMNNNKDPSWSSQEENKQKVRRTNRMRET